MWAEEGTPTTLDQMGQPVPTASIVIGSIRLAVRVSYIIQSIIDLICRPSMLHPYCYNYCSPIIPKNAYCGFTDHGVYMILVEILDWVGYQTSILFWYQQKCVLPIKYQNTVKYQKLALIAVCVLYFIHYYFIRQFLKP